MTNSRKLKLKTTSIFNKNLTANTDIVVNRGGTRSSKTYSLCQLMCFKLISEPNKRIIIARKTFPSLRHSVLKDMITMLKQLGIYDLGHHNKSEHTFTYNYTQSQLIFLSVDDAHKVRGLESNYVWLNEADAFTFEDFNQLYLRLSRKSEDNKMNQIYLDFNPSDMYCWIKTQIEDKGRAKIIQSNYTDNTFLDVKTVQRIEYMKENDPNFWRIYGMGEWGEIKGLIYNNWEAVNDLPLQYDWRFMGLDFGFTNDPSALIEIRKEGQYIYVNELIYETGLTNLDLIDKMVGIGITNVTIYADSAEPKSIAEINKQSMARAAKIRLVPTTKGRDSVKHGINIVQQQKLKITNNSHNLQKEIRNYKWQEKNGELINAPINAQGDHALDALRYAITGAIGMRKSVRAFA